MNKDTKDIKVDGKPNKFGEATRHTKENKGRFDLIPGEVINGLAELIGDLFKKRKSYSITPLTIMKAANDGAYLSTILMMIAYNKKSKIEGFNFGDEVTFTYVDVSSELFVMLSDLAIHFQKGAEIYGERNCENGIPLWSFRDSGIRHLTQWIRGLDDEPHYISAIWNFVMAVWTIWNHPERCEGYNGPDLIESSDEDDYSDGKCKSCECKHDCEDCPYDIEPCSHTSDDEEENTDDVPTKESNNNNDTDNKTGNSEYEDLRKISEELKNIFESNGVKIDEVKAYAFDPNNCKTEDITDKLFSTESKGSESINNEHKQSTSIPEEIATAIKHCGFNPGNVMIHKVVHERNTQPSKEEIINKFVDVLNKIL